MPLNPFDKPLGETLTIDDLQLLITRSVSEGYFVEYKSQMQPKDKIAKSIAALVNTHGGWYFVGVDADKTHNVATKICGFSLAAHADPIAIIREVAKSRISPTPVFYPQVVNITSDVVVLVVYVPDEQDTPFLTKDGRIYRRIADSSDPVYEKDRYAVDQLYEQGRKNVQRFERFCSDNRTFSKSESGSWVSIFLSPHPYGMIEKNNLLLSKEGLEKVLQRSKMPVNIPQFEKYSLGGNVPLNSGQFTNRSVILRQVSPRHVAFNSLTVELFIDGSAKFFIPISPLAFDPTKDTVLAGLQSSIAQKALQSYIAKDGAEHSLQYLHFFDVGKLYSAIVHLVNYYLDWLGDLSLLTAFKAAMILSDVWRLVPFADEDEWGMHVAKFGLPIMSADLIKIPEDIGRGTILSLDEDDPSIWGAIIGLISLAFGLPHDLSSRLFVNEFVKK